MPNIQAFRGLRYDLGHVGSLGDVVAPPYDVIDSDFQTRLYKQHPCNVIRLILNRHEPGDDEASNRYSRAARFLKNWQAEGVLFSESDPAIYVYHQQFEFDGQSMTRRGFMARVHLERFGEGNIYPHEETHPGPKADRLKLMTACRANLSQIFGLYPDPESEVQNLLEKAIVGKTSLEATDHLGVVHRLWPVTDIEVISRVSGLVGPKPTFIADGHHRYETACNYRDQLAAKGPLDANHPANYVLMMCVGMSDPGTIVLPTHRLFRGLPEMTSEELSTQLRGSFDVSPQGEGSKLAENIWEQIEIEADQGTLGLYTKKDNQWLIARITEAGRQKMADVSADHSDQWQALGVSILHRLLVETILGATDLPTPQYVHLVEELVEGLDGDTGNDFPLAALVMPATLEHIRSIGQNAERMPAKSTYFYPKLLSGLVINPLA